MFKVLGKFCLIYSGNLPKPVQYFTYPTTDEQTVTSEKTQEARFTYPSPGNLEVIKLYIYFLWYNFFSSINLY